ncbi:laminin subunit alpha-1-like [Saccoglossus kowalevskii]
MAADTGCNFRIPHPHFRFKRWTFLLVFLTLLHNTRTQENVNSQACEKVLSSGTVTYHACISKIEFLSFLNLDPIIEPENSTCGYETDPKNNEYCTLGYDQDCSECDATQPDLAHPAPYVIDTASSGGELTWWQSRSWLDFVSEDDDFIINVTLSMRKGYELSDKIKITFKSGRPQKMVILKSSNNGETWDPYQYYARDCVSAFGMEPKADPSDITDVTEVICTPAYSGSLPEKDGIVEFDLNFRLEKLFADTVGSDNDLSLFYEVFESDEIRNYIDVTDIRISLMYPATDGLETTLKPENLRNYFYAISDIYSSVRCQCNLHAENCNELSGGQYSCDCKHNTMGVNCELCLPLYNNRPWQAGSYLPYPSGTANECQLCDCNEHAANCSYDETVGKGVCEGCEDNTAGLFCEICVAGYYRNQSEPVNSPDVCIGCDCEPLGTLPTSENVTECSQYENDVTGQPVGQCSCIDFVTGRRCDECIDEYYGLKQVESAGLCKECGCKILGTVNASNVCEKTEGQCPCKPNTFERDCSRCKDGFYAFPSSTEMDCLACRCDYGGSYTQICNIVSGLCDCRPNLIGQRCNMVDSGYFYNYLDANSYDSWDAVSACSRESDLPIDYTGVGYLVCQDNTNVLFQNVKAFSVMSDIQKYLPVIRYSYNSSDNWYSASLSLSATGDSANQDLLHELAGDVDPDTSSGNTTDAPTTADITCSVQAGIIMSIAVVFTPGQDISWQPVNVEDDLLDVDRRCNYELNLQLMSSGDGADNIQIDSLVLMPVLTDFQVYKYGVSTEMYNGGIPCDCNMNYSMGDTCTAHGGQCVCKTGVYGRQCDRCQPGYYNLTEDGCTPCNCDPLGSASLVCDFESGQCPCQEGVATLATDSTLSLEDTMQCRLCQTDYYGFSSGSGCTPCDCSEDGSTSLQCDELGECQCKDTIGGAKCDQCLPGYHDFTADGCSGCDCNVAGSVESTCDPNGICTCKANVEGDKCDQCKSQTYNLQALNPDGCQSCFCYTHSLDCTSAENYIPDVISSDFSNSRYDGWTATDPSFMAATTIGLLIPTGDTTDTLHIVAPSKYLGNKLSSYVQYLSYSASINDVTIRSLMSNQSIIIHGKNFTQSVVYNGDSFVLTNKQTTFKALLHESVWSYVDSDVPVLLQDFQGILADISSIQIRATFGYVGLQMFVYDVSLDTVALFENAPNGTVFSTSVEQCNCENFHVTGLSCQECSTGFKRASPDDGSYSICEACECPYIDPSADPNTQPSAQRATECEPDTGICIDCSSGSTGDFCEICKENVKGPDCDRCISFFYGFDTELFGGACNACNCNTTGTGGVMECDNGSGQCTCIGNYGGKQCARCKDNFYDYDSGCVPCDSCYDVIDEEMTKLRELTQNLTDFVGYLSSQDNTTELGPFYIRLQETEDVIMELAANINEAVAEEDDLNARIESLNGTMQTLMSLLSNDITNAVNETNVDINEAVDNVAGSKDTIDTIEQRITDSYNMLNSGTLEQAQITLQALQSDLNKLDIQITSAASSTTGDIADLEAQVDDMSTKTEAARQSALQALQTVQEAQLLHDNTTNRVSDLRSAATFVQQKSENLDSQATEMLSRAQSTNQEATAALTKAMSPNDNADTDVENLIDSASVKIAQAGAIENQATQALEQNLYIIDEVADAGNITDITLAEVNTVTADVTARYDRSTNAYTLANSALELSGATFDAANEMLNTLENFESIVDEVEQAADTAMDTVASVVELSNSATLEARAIQSELSDSELHADSALSIADEAFNMAEAERESVAPANNRANQLAEEAAAKLTDTDSLIQDVKSINTTLVAPQQAICNDYATTMDTLEATVLEATDQSNQALVMVAQTETDLKLLLASLENIGTIDTSQLSGYAERIAAARNTFTETDFAASIAALKIAVDEQQTWLDRTRLKVDSLQSQVDALESFRVTSG